MTNSRFKFRVYDHTTDTLAYFDLRGSMGNLPLDIPDENIQQCTGILDKNGNEIYEGDVIKITDGDLSFHSCVRWSFLSHSFVAESPNGSNVFIWMDLYNGGIEVVGNIFDKPNDVIPNH